MGTLGTQWGVGSRESGLGTQWGHWGVGTVGSGEGNFKFAWMSFRGGGDSIGVMKLRALGLLQREAIRRRRSPSPFILRLYTNALRRVGVKLP